MNLKSSNPFFKNKSYTKTAIAPVYDAEGRPVEIIDYNDTMTINGAINKAMLLFAILVASSVFSVYLMLYREINPYILVITGLISGFLIALFATFRPQHSRYLAPAYALFEGLFVGAISIVFEVLYPGIVLQAVGATIVTFGVCFLLYRFKIVKVTQQFKSVVIAATLAIGTYYLISILLNVFTGIRLFHYDNGLLSIGFSVFVVIIAALNLFIDFDLIEQGAERRLPKYMEWFGGMALIITLVWLYVEFLRLLSKLRD
jgi:uncharacterized YccA/Bax inhibitor family protein